VIHWAITGMAVYMLGFVAVMWVQVLDSGPGVTFGGILLRALAWPLYILLGIFDRRGD